MKIYWGSQSSGYKRTILSLEMIMIFDELIGMGKPFENIRKMERNSSCESADVHVPSTVEGVYFNSFPICIINPRVSQLAKTDGFLLICSIIAVG